MSRGRVLTSLILLLVAATAGAQTVVAGRVTAADGGDPVIAVQVTAMTVDAAGKTTVVATGETDDRGEYRIGRIPAKPIVIGVTTLAAVGNQRVQVGQPRVTYYPAASAPADAQVLRLRPGEVLPNVDIVVAADRLDGAPESLFAARFLPREPSATGRPGLTTVPATAAGSVRGQVRTTAGAPVSRARVFLFAERREDSRTTTTDEDGGYELTQVASGRALLCVIKPGYAQVERGAQVAAFVRNRASTSPTPDDAQYGRPLTISGDGTVADMEMARQGVIAGTITGEDGQPVAGARVDLLQVQYDRGRRRLVPAGDARVTDDLGDYRLYNLRPGRYLVSAIVGPVSAADMAGYGRSYFPGTADAGAARDVSVAVGEETGGIDFQLTRAPTVHVSGSVVGVTGERIVPASLTLLPSARSAAIADVGFGARIAPDGTFVFPNVTPGEYVVQAYWGRTGTASEGMFGATRVTVGTADVNGIVVRASTGSTIQGRVRLDVAGPSATRMPPNIRVVAIPADFDLSPPDNWASAEVQANRTFTLSGLSGPRRLEVTGVPAGLTVRDVRIGDEDVTDQPLPLGAAAQSVRDIVITLADRVASVGGRVTDDDDRAAARAAVILFPIDRGNWYFGSRYWMKTETAADGTFIVSGIPAGNYYVAALTSLPDGGDDAWQDPGVLESLITGASTVAVADAQPVTIALRVESR